MLPKNSKIFPTLLEAVVFDSSSRIVTFHPLCFSKTTAVTQTEQTESTDASTEVAYGFSFVCEKDDHSHIELVCSSSLEMDIAASFHPSPRWLLDSLAPKVRQWTEMTDLTTSVTSLRLVSIDSYNQLYCTLKEKYGADLVKNWTESTDPQKFVYEDIGIATYLLLIWEEDRQKTGRTKKQTFVDLGCGNGLLVYILTKEGHAGLGVDLRKRNIWAKYDTDVRLEERSITPSADNLFPDFDWIIGNHSDELTPWIPVIAARSSYSCSYLVLPCCLHDFNRRFNTRVKGETSYRSYLTYIQQVGRACGFLVEEDTLRIPSTKRVCQIGRHRTYPADQEAEADTQRQQFIDDRCTTKLTPHPAKPSNNSSPTNHIDQSTDLGSSSSSPDTQSLKRTIDGAVGDQSRPGDVKCESGTWTENFQARSNTERVRNCQKVSWATKDRVVRAVFDSVMNADDAVTALGHDGKAWRKGGSIALGKVAEMLDSATRDELKSECGGVQTLLRNHHNIFQVSGGKVQLRDFSVANPWSQHKTAKSGKGDNSVLKTSLCWFHAYHPDGCPRASQDCSFAHGAGELRPREIVKKK
ncbi:hypothetical protein V1264_021429 [Littorina saxatilis]